MIKYQNESKARMEEPILRLGSGNMKLEKKLLWITALVFLRLVRLC